MNLKIRDYSQYHEKYRGQTINLTLGYSPKKKSPITYPLEQWGTTLIEAKSRVGKTSETLNLLAQLHRAGRKLVIFDPYGDYVNMGEPNFRSKHGIYCVDDIHVEEDFAFSISNFRGADFATFGFTEKGLAMMGDVAPRVDMHKNDPNFVADFITDLPDKWTMIERFNKQYGWNLKRPIHESKINAMADTYRHMKPYFYDANVSPELGLHSLDNVAEIVLKHDVTVFYFDVATHGKTKFQIYAAIILRMLKPILPRIKATIVLEEGDLLAPNTAGQGMPPTSWYEIDEYCRKLGRTGTHLIAISQNDADFNPSLARNWHGIILGKLNPGSKYYDLTDSLYWDPRKGIRQLLYLDSNNRKYVFEPQNPPTK